MSDATQCSDPIDLLQSRIRKLEEALHRAVVLLDESRWQGTNPDATLEDRIAEGKAIDKGIKLLIKDTEEMTGVSDGG